MSKFNLRGVLRTGTSPVATADHATGTTYEGAPGFGRDPKSELFLLAVTSLVSEDTFYEAAAERDARLRELVARVAVADYDWTFGLVGWLRKGVHLRSVALVVAAEAVRARLAAGLAGGNRALVSAALDRADEPGEFLAYWASRYGRRFPQPVKRGVADAAVRLYSERSLVKYDGDGRAFRFADVLELTHAAPKDARQSALFRYALDRRHDRADAVPAELGVLRARERLLALPVEDRRAVLLGEAPAERLRAAGMTWEQVGGWLQGPLDAAAWEALSGSMGYMALLRNLRNFDEPRMGGACCAPPQHAPRGVVVSRRGSATAPSSALRCTHWCDARDGATHPRPIVDEAGVSDEMAAQVAAKLADAGEVARSRQLPLRYLSAYRSAPSLRWAWALERALQASLGSVPSLAGRTLVLVDRSGSMFCSLSRRSSVTRADAAAVFGAALAVRAASADLVEFGTDSRRLRVRRGASVLSLAERMDALGGTNTADAVRRHFRRHDRVVIVTDEQAWGGWYGEDPTAAVPPEVPVYTFNLAGFRYGHGPSGVGNRHTFGGLSDQGFAAIPLLEAGRDQRWPF